MRIPPLKKAIFLHRLNRFVGEVEVEGRKELVHIPNTGRLDRLLIKGNIVNLQPIQGKLRYRLFSVEDGGDVVVVDSFIGEKLLTEEWEKRGVFPIIGRIKRWKRAPIIQGMRLDFLVEGENGFYIIEQKSSTLLIGETAYFPDAPTDRGYRQLLALFEGERLGFIPMFIMVIKHPKATKFSFAHHIDERFSSKAEEFVRAFPFLLFKLVIKEEELSLVPFLPAS
ncbi:DNA/RNA nuclease SfsA [bacterium]|nr:DNA/RNA nuclease SfsA [bacterium]